MIYFFQPREKANLLLSHIRSHFLIKIPLKFIFLIREISDTLYRV